MSYSKEDWEQWSYLHEESKSLTRAKSALSKKLTPLSLDPENGLAIFSGSTGDEYETTLSTCACHDFSSRHYAPSPCKHMYRLAMEVGFHPNDGMETRSREEFLAEQETEAHINQQIEDLSNFIMTAPYPDVVDLAAFLDRVKTDPVPRKKVPDNLPLIYNDLFFLVYSNPKCVRRNTKFTRYITVLLKTFQKRVLVEEKRKHKESVKSSLSEKLSTLDEQS